MATTQDTSAEDSRVHVFQQEVMRRGNGSPARFTFLRVHGTQWVVTARFWGDCFAVLSRDDAQPSKMEAQRKLCELALPRILARPLPAAALPPAASSSGASVPATAPPPPAPPAPAAVSVAVPAAPAVLAPGPVAPVAVPAAAATTMVVYAPPPATILPPPQASGASLLGQHHAFPAAALPPPPQPMNTMTLVAGPAPPPPQPPVAAAAAPVDLSPLGCILPPGYNPSQVDADLGLELVIRHICAGTQGRAEAGFEEVIQKLRLAIRKDYRIDP